jgi:hypothetical protein
MHMFAAKGDAAAEKAKLEKNTAITAVARPRVRERHRNLRFVTWEVLRHLRRSGVRRSEEAERRGGPA